MGRRPVKKERIDDPELKMQWVRKLLPIYIDNGLRKISMDDVAAELGVSKATLYKHFRSREEIIEHALIIKLNDIGSFKEKLFDEEQPYWDRYFNAIYIFFHEISGISTEFLFDLKSLYPDIWKRVEFFRSYASDQLRNFYQQGIELGLFNNISPAMLVASDKLYFDLISDPEFLKEQQLTLQQSFKDYFTLRTKGLFQRSDKDLDDKISKFITQIANN